MLASASLTVGAKTICNSATFWYIEARTVKFDRSGRCRCRSVRVMDPSRTTLARRARVDSRDSGAESPTPLRSIGRTCLGLLRATSVNKHATFPGWSVQTCSSTETRWRRPVSTPPHFFCCIPPTPAWKCPGVRFAVNIDTRRLTNLKNSGYLSLRAFARAAGITYYTVRLMVRLGQLSTVPFGRRVRVHRKWLRELRKGSLAA